MPTYAESKLAPEHYGFPIWQTQLRSALSSSMQHELADVPTYVVNS